MGKKRLLSIILILAMALSLTGNVFAVENDPTEPFDIMVINSAQNKTIVKPDGSIKFHFKYKVTGLEKVDGKFV